tara:strand:- start:173 stop:475 length:303 start_codon:yes stop_codon:yes gene_type:complete
MKKMLTEWRQFLKENEYADKIQTENFELLEKITDALRDLGLDWVMEDIIPPSSEDGRDEMISEIDQELMNAGETDTTVESILKKSRDQILKLTREEIEKL